MSKFVVGLIGTVVILGFLAAVGYAFSHRNDDTNEGQVYRGMIQAIVALVLAGILLGLVFLGAQIADRLD